MTEPALVLREEVVVSLLDLADAVAALTDGLHQEARNDALLLDKTVVTFRNNATLHALGAVLHGDGLVGTKTWAHTPGGADPHVLLFDADDGHLVAFIEAFALGQMRTAAAAAVATRHLAAPDARTLAIVGTGRQALSQVAAVAAVRSLELVNVFSPTPEHRRDFAEEVTKTLGLVAVAAGSVEEAVASADVVSLVTRARQAFLGPDQLHPGVHLNAMGAITLERAEIDPAVLARCAYVATDSLEQVRRLSSELKAYYDVPPRSWSDVRRLADLVSEDVVRPPGADLTLFKGMGSGLEDVALGVAIYRRAVAAGVGMPLEHGRRAHPRLTSARPSAQSHEREGTPS